jgi:uncharacterized protein (TIGR02145 family)
MRKAMATTFLAGLAGLALTGCDRDTSAFSTQDADRFRSLVSGRITDRQGAPVTGALVTALPGGTTTVSGDSGKFQLTLPSGSYQVSVIKDEYLDTTLSDSLHLPLLAKDTLSRLGLVYRYATLSGKVLTAGAPQFAGIVVQDQTVSATALTNVPFTLGKIEPGPVQVFAVVPNVGYASFSTVFQPSDTLKNVILNVSLPGGVVQGQVVNTVAASARRLTGSARKMAATGNGISNVSVQAFGGILRTVTAVDGSFSLPTIPGSGSVVLTIDDTTGHRTQSVTGVKVREGRILDIGDVWLNSTAGRSDSTPRSSIALVHASDSSTTLLAWTGNDTGLHVSRWKWDLNGGSDTTRAGRTTLWKTAYYSGRWKSGDTFQVHAWPIFLDSAHKTLRQAINPATITVEVLPDPDTTAPSLARAFSLASSNHLWNDSVATVKWSVSDAGGVDSAWVNNRPAGLIGDTITVKDTLSVGSDTLVLKVRDSSGNIATDIVTLTRAAKPQPPKVARPTYTNDTNFVRFVDSTPTVVWNVFRGAKLASLVLQGQHLPIHDSDVVQVADTIHLEVSKPLTLRLWASDSLGDTARDSVVLVRLDTTAMVLSRLFSPGSTNHPWQDSTPTIRWIALTGGGVDSIWVNNAPATFSGDTISVTKTLKVGSNVLALKVRDLFGKVAIDTVTLTRGAKPPPPKLVRSNFSTDTVFARFVDTSASVTWKVVRGAKLASIVLQGKSQSVHDSDTVQVSATVPLAVLKPLTVKLWASDSIGDTARDSVVLVRRDTTHPVLARLSPMKDTSRAFQDSMITPSWKVTDNLTPDSVWVNGIGFLLGKGRWPSVHLAVGTDTVSVKVRNAVGLVAVDTLFVTRLDTTAPILMRRVPMQDTTRSWVDSLVNVSWTVIDALSPDSLWLNGKPFSLSVTAGWPNETLSVGRNVVYLNVRNALGKWASDSIVLTRSPRFTYGTLVDTRDNQSYKTIAIGKQVWMAQDLNYKVDSSWCPLDSSNTCATYGRLYSWAAAMDTTPKYNSTFYNANGGASVQGACPAGWHVPSQSDWNALQSTVNNSSLKSTSGWDKNMNSGDNWGFTGLPAGYRDTTTTATFYPIGAYARFWSSSETSATQAGSLDLSYNSVQATLAQFDKRTAYSVRCISN